MATWTAYLSCIGSANEREASGMSLTIFKGRANHCLDGGRDVEIRLANLQMYDINALAFHLSCPFQNLRDYKGAISSALLAIKLYILLLSSPDAPWGPFPIFLFHDH